MKNEHIAAIGILIGFFMKDFIRFLKSFRK